MTPTGFQGVGKVYSPSSTRRAIAVNFSAVFLALFFAGPQLGSLDADLDGVAEVPVIGTTSVRSIECRGYDTRAAAATPQFAPALAIDVALPAHEVAAFLPPYVRLAERDPLILRC